MTHEQLGVKASRTQDSTALKAANRSTAAARACQPPRVNPAGANGFEYRVCADTLFDDTSPSNRGATIARRLSRVAAPSEQVTTPRRAAAAACDHLYVAVGGLVPTAVPLFTESRASVDESPVWADQAPRRSEPSLLHSEQSWRTRCCDGRRRSVARSPGRASRPTIEMTWHELTSEA